MYQFQGNSDAYMTFTSCVHTSIAQIKMIRLVLGISIDFSYKFQQSFFPQAVFQIFPNRPRK